MHRRGVGLPPLSNRANKTMSFSNDIVNADYVGLVTYRKSGKEVPSPVWHAEYNGALYIFSEGKAGKVKRLRNSPKSKIAICSYKGDVKGDWVDTEGFIVDDTEEIKAAYRAFDKKYGLKVKIFNFFSKLGGKYSKRAMLRLTPAESE